MLYKISLKIGYEYPQVASGGRHLLCMMPAHIPGRQHLISGYVDVKPGWDERTDRFDFFNNAVTEVASHKDHSTMDFHLKAQVECFVMQNWFDNSPDLGGLKQEIREVKDLSYGSPHHFSASSDLAPFDPDVALFAKETLRDGQTVINIVENLGLKIHEEMDFDPEATTVETPMSEAFANRHGVCQDYTHIMISGLRSLGIPAAYVSGFIRTIPPEGQERLEGADAMHAWVRAWCGPHVGWVEYDPTNAMFVNTDHIVVAYGRDYEDVSPVKGVLKTFGGQKTTQAVDVILLQP